MATVQEDWMIELNHSLELAMSVTSLLTIDSKVARAIVCSGTERVPLRQQ